MKKTLFTAVCQRYAPCCFLSLLLLLTITSFSQSFAGYQAFGTFTQEEAKLKQVDFDKEASAVIIHDLARSEHNDEYNLITEHRVKIKILNDKGIDNANVTIRYYSKDGFEFINGVQAIIRSYKADGSYNDVTLDRKSIYDKKISEYYSEVRFTMPNAKAGSIFEYTYFSNKKHYGGLEDWKFQGELPIMHSFYSLAILPNTEFSYKVYKLPTFDIAIDDKTQGWVTFKMDNIPTLRDEAYMDARRDNLQRVAFQLSAINRTGYKQKVVETWDDVSREMLDMSSVGGQLNKSLPGTDDFIKVTKAISDPIARLKATYKYTQQHISSNGYIGWSSPDGIRKAWDKGSGNSGEVNLAFISLLKQVDITAIPLLTNERFRGKIDINYPSLDQFSNLLTYVTLTDKSLVIDASDKETPIGMVPYDLLNTYGYKVSKKDKGLMLIADDKLYDDNRISINAALGNDGILKGTVIDFSRDYARMERKADYKKNGANKFIEEYFSEGYTNLKADSLIIENLDNDSLPLTQALQFTQTLNTSGDYTFLDYHLFTGLAKNPFTSDTRFSDINFGSPRRYAVTELIQLPENFEVDALPKNISMITPDTAFSLYRYIKVENGVLSAQLKLTINRSFFDRDEYETLQSFYKQMFAILNEQVVLKQKS